MSSDTCAYGWGAACDGVRTGGQFSSEESLLHINVTLDVFLRVTFLFPGHLAYTYIAPYGR